MGLIHGDGHINFNPLSDGGDIKSAENLNYTPTINDLPKEAGRPADIKANIQKLSQNRNLPKMLDNLVKQSDHTLVYLQHTMPEISNESAVNYKIADVMVKLFNRARLN